MNFDKLKSDTYEFLGLILPGLLLIAEAWITLGGWTPFLTALTALSGTSLALLLIVAFGLGHLVQEGSDAVIKRFTSQRFFKQARDRYWASTEAALLKAKIAGELGNEPLNADAAFDYCLTRAQATFSKRDVFIATADLSRALFLLTLLGLIPSVRCTVLHWSAWTIRVSVALGCLCIHGLVAWLWWRRMVRFREYAEVPVFRAYLSGVSSPQPSHKEASA